MQGDERSPWISEVKLHYRLVPGTQSRLPERSAPGRGTGLWCAAYGGGWMLQQKGDVRCKHA